MAKEKHVYACAEGRIRGQELTDDANATGEISARFFPEGKRRLVTLDVAALQREIGEEELVVLITEPPNIWLEDYELSERAKALLGQAGRRWRSDTHANLLAELALRNVK
jgi:hypothetical protein